MSKTEEQESTKHQSSETARNIRFQTPPHPHRRRFSQSHVVFLPTRRVLDYVAALTMLFDDLNPLIGAYAFFLVALIRLTV
ncbi:hypothetical protein SISSUDRAFT_1066507 [Sistotremastrum suecicum HHB10207 ss-3]|uniref:Uncharacterized protein n=1 Tax=Sistotremastrum suecicum HHB10207 ss-3 TaxID=1314776 RepID=A0A165Y8Q7_9AGAM|nr:hypothetical protein SISSUDRAFT_1066507 [Sistotremastrum suecicum HHB10207 ss-3]